MIEDECGGFDRMRVSLRTPEIKIIDLIDELLSEILERSDAELGAFYHDDFHEWLTERTNICKQSKGVVCTQLDAWLATCGRLKSLDFFRNFSRRIYVVPVLLVTAQTSLVKNSDFPEDQVWHVRDMETA